MVFSTDPNAEDIEAEYAALDRREVSSQGNRGIKYTVIGKGADLRCGMINLSLTMSQLYEGLRVQDLRRLKDMLIVETADMLQAPLFTAEALLRAHGTHAIITLKYLLAASTLGQVSDFLNTAQYWTC